MMTPRIQQQSEAGFTLLELLIVIAILAMLAVVGTLQLSGYLGRARSDTARLQLDQLSTALDLFRVDLKRLPTTDGCRRLARPLSEKIAGHQRSVGKALHLSASRRAR
jgi:general secretion pathway protein G